MSKVAEARQLLSMSAAPYERHDQAFANESLVPAFEAASDADKTRMIDAAVTLLLDGAAAEKSVAAAFLEAVPVPPSIWHGLVAEYESRGYDDSQPLACLLGNSWPLLAPAEITALTAIFLAKPSRQLQIGRVVVRRAPTGRVFDALRQAAEQLTDPDQLQLASRVYSAAHRFPDFVSVMRAKPQEVQKATAEKLSSAHYDEFVAALGIG